MSAAASESTHLDPAFFRAARARLGAHPGFVADGCVRSVIGNVIEGEGIRARLGSTCWVDPGDGERAFAAEVVGFRDDRFLMLPLGEARGCGPGARVHVGQSRATTPVGAECLGRVLDGLGRPIDGGPPLEAVREAPLVRRPEHPLRRERISRPLDVGVRAINGLMTLGRGARLGIFAGSGVGKSTLLGQIARYTTADVNVIALIGERGREVREFIERDLGDALARSVVVVATSDETPLLRTRAALAATAIAESFRDDGAQVLLMMDSVTRFCMALREIGLAAGEPPTTRGYAPSVWSQLPRLLERAGTSSGGGSITGVYTVLVEGDDPNEPVADAARSILDGHILLSREIGARGVYPSIDVLNSVSRVMTDVVPDEHLRLARRAREVLATWRRAEDLIAIGAYVAGSDRAIDEARRLEPLLRAFLRQAPTESTKLQDTVDQLRIALGEAGTA